jgi:hypothetical protein
VNDLLEKFEIRFGWLLAMLLVVMTGCGTSAANDSTEPAMAEKQMSDRSIILMANEKEILVGDTFYNIGKAKLKTISGEKLTASMLMPGDLIQLKSTGMVLESFPSQGEATKVVLYDDPRSKEISEGIQYILENHQTGKDIIRPSLQSIKNDQLVIQFYEWEVHGKKYEATLDLKTKDLKVIEIVNEEAKALEEQRQKQMKNRKDAAYSGYITKVLPDGVRINRIDFTFDESIYFKNQTGGKLTEADFEVGTFVTAYYNGNADDQTFPYKAPLYGLEKLTKEEDPAISSWVRSLTEGDQFIEPVIMDFWGDRFNKTYTIKIIDIKKTKKFLYILTYNRKTGTHTTEEIPNK